MTKYQINPNRSVWDAIKELKPSDANLDDYTERVLAREVVRNEDHPGVEQEHIKAAEHVLRDADHGGDGR
jgi:hypothetical protein